MTIMSNQQVLKALHDVRVRQIPWHKQKPLFAALREFGLVVPAGQLSQSNPDRPTVLIAVLTELGRQEFDRLSRSQRAAQWRMQGLVAYVSLA